MVYLTAAAFIGAFFGFFVFPSAGTALWALFWALTTTVLMLDRRK